MRKKCQSYSVLIKVKLKTEQRTYIFYEEASISANARHAVKSSKTKFNKLD